MNAEFVRDRITQLRLQKNVSEYKMSYDLGHSRGYINNISSGKVLPSMAECFSICEYFDITPVGFFRTDIVNPKEMKQVVEDIELLNPADLKLVHSMVKRLINEE